MKKLLSAPLSSRKIVEYPLLFLLLASIISAAAYGGYWYGKRTTQPTVPQSTTPKQSPQSRFPPEPSPELADETADWKLYTSDKWGFSIKYPPQWLVSEEYDIETHFSNKK